MMPLSAGGAVCEGVGAAICVFTAIVGVNVGDGGGAEIEETAGMVSGSRPKEKALARRQVRRRACTSPGI